MFGDVELLNETCTLSLCKGEGPMGWCHPPWPAEIGSHVSGVEQCLLVLGLIGTWKLQTNSPPPQNFMSKSNICIFTRGSSLPP